MKNVVLIAVLLGLAGCSRGGGVYVGQVMDASWEGWFWSSCEVDWKTSEQASSVQVSASRDERLCNELQANIGKKYKVTYQHYIPAITTTARYRITKLEPVN